MNVVYENRVIPKLVIGICGNCVLYWLKILSWLVEIVEVVFCIGEYSNWKYPEREYYKYIISSQVDEE